MSEIGSADVPLSEVVVQLLDAAHGRPVQTWKFTNQRQITLGRSDERDVEISDPYVSRLHAELCFRDDKWVLISRGRNGVVVSNQLIVETPVDSAIIFQLGPAGPSLRFFVPTEETGSMRTLSFDTETMPIFAVDNSKVREDVGQIADGDYFQKLQAQAKTLRQKRSL